MIRHLKNTTSIQVRNNMFSLYIYISCIMLEKATEMLQNSRSHMLHKVSSEPFSFIMSSSHRKKRRAYRE